MPDLKIKKVDPEMIARLDAESTKLGYSDRSALVRDIIAKYLASHDQMIVEELPDMTQALVKDALREYPEKLRVMLEFVLQQQQETTLILKKITAIFEVE